MRGRGQTKYQVRFGWGAAGAAAIAADAHLLVWVDVLPVGAGPITVPTRLLPEGPEVVLGHLGNARAVAERVTGLQAERGDRCVVAVVAAGIEDRAAGAEAAADAGEALDDLGRPDFAAEDLLAAGAVVDALTEVGIDHTSPEAAVASAAYTGLRRAVKHLVSASAGAASLPVERVREALAAGPVLVTVRDGEHDGPGRRSLEDDTHT